MTDLSQTVAPKSDQLNADDLIPGPKTVRITKVSRCNEPEQPIAISFDGDGGKPYKPCKSMRRVMINVWGSDGNAYVGRSMTLFRDPKVLWGGMEVGGIRLSHMSDIKEPVTMALTTTKQSRKPFTVKPLVVEKPLKPLVAPAPAAPTAPDKATLATEALVGRIWSALVMADLEEITRDETAIKQRAWLADKRPELAQLVDVAVSEKLAALAPAAEPETAEAADDGWPGPR